MDVFIYCDNVKLNDAKLYLKFHCIGWKPEAFPNYLFAPRPRVFRCCSRWFCILYTKIAVSAANTVQVQIKNKRTIQTCCPSRTSDEMLREKGKWIS